MERRPAVVADREENAVMEIFEGIDELKASLGREIGPGEWFTVEQSRIDGFADDTEDHQWIHVDPERAAGGPFGAPIAHGFLTLSLLPHLLNGVRRVEGVTMGVNYGLEKVRFPAPVRVGSRIRARATIVDLTDIAGGGVQTVTRTTVDIEGVQKPACVAELVSRYYFAA